MDILQGKFLLSGIFTTLAGISIAKDSTSNGHAVIPRMIVQHPIHQLPFIPASALRGATRHILEKQASNAKVIAEIFGQSVHETVIARYPGRVTFRDAILTPATITRYQNQFTQLTTYIKTDRVTAQSNLFAVEQILAGVHFQFEILFSIYCREDMQLLKEFWMALHELQNASLGGLGSRGLGKIQFGEWKISQDGIVQPELLSGVRLVWRSQQYYQTGTGEKVFASCEEKLCFPELIAVANHIEQNILQTSHTAIEAAS